MGYGSLNGISIAPSAQDLAADGRSLGALKASADKATPETIRETAKQFESLFMGELIKSMREATMKSGMLDNPGSDLGTDLLDKQFAVSMSGQPGSSTPIWRASCWAAKWAWNCRAAAQVPATPAATATFRSRW